MPLRRVSWRKTAETEELEGAGPGGGGMPVHDEDPDRWGGPVRLVLHLLVGALIVVFLVVPLVWLTPYPATFATLPFLWLWVGVSGVFLIAVLSLLYWIVRVSL